jgi:DNA primase
MKSVKDFLEQKGYKWKPKGNLWVTNSPFKPGGDSNPSFYLYPSGVFKCYSTGKAGNAITLAKFFNESLAEVSDYVPSPT